MTARIEEQLKRSVAPTTVRKTELNTRERIINGLSGILGVEARIQKTDSIIPQFVWEHGPKARRPIYDNFNMVIKAQYAWPLRVVFEAISREVLRNWGHIEPRFVVKCSRCHEEYQEDIDSCETTFKNGNKCKGKLQRPDPRQKRRFVEFTKAPSKDRTFREFWRSSLFYALSTDDFYWSVRYEAHRRRHGHVSYRGKEAYVEHPGFIFPVVDEYGFLGGYEFFCPKCYSHPDYRGKDLKWDMREDMTAGNSKEYFFKCPECGDIMVQTAYIQEVAGKVTARFGRNEIVHGSASRLAPDLFGNSRMMALMKVIEYLEAVDEYKRETTIESRTAGMMAMPGMSHDTVHDILLKIKKERERLVRRDIQTGQPETTRRTALIFVGLGEENTSQPVLIPFTDTQELKSTIEFYRLYMRAIGDMYGVSTMLIQAGQAGAQGRQDYKLRIEVLNHTTEDNHLLLAETFNEQFLPLCRITDWIWVWDEIEPKDKLRNAEIDHMKAATALTALQAGFKVKWGEDGNLSISGEGKLQENIGHTGQPNVEPGVSPARPGRHVQPPEISPETGEERTP
jgi:hypothetical protein